MALQKTFVKTQEPFIGSLEISAAYWRVERVEASKEQTIAIVSVNKKVGESTRMVDQKRYAFVVTLDGKNFIAQAYDHLKTLPEFASATDC